jgi:predicted dehydrogenase
VAAERVADLAEVVVGELLRIVKLVVVDEALEPGAYERFYAGVRDALRDGTDMPVDPRDSVAALRVIDAARRSAQTTNAITQEEIA